MIGVYVEKAMRRVRRLRQIPRAATVPLKNGVTVELRPASDPHERDVFLDGIYEPGTLSLFDQLLRPGDTFIDIGANLGLMTLHASRRVGPTGKVIAIEPHPAYFPRLAKHITLNGATNVTPLNVAAGDTHGTVPIFDVPAANIGRSSLIKPHAVSAVGGMVEVQTLDEIAATLTSVRLVKIDVEGFEANVLRGSRETLRKHRPIICMEVSTKVHEGADPLAAHNLLMATGLYSAHRFRYGKGHASPLVPAGELQGIDDNVVYLPHTL